MEDGESKGGGDSCLSVCQSAVYSRRVKCVPHAILSNLCLKLAPITQHEVGKLQITQVNLGYG